MSANEIRDSLINEIKKMDNENVKLLYKIIKTVKAQKKDEDLSWNDIPESHKQKIKTGLQQLKNGEGIPAEIVMAKLKKKYGLKS